MEIVSGCLTNALTLFMLLEFVIWPHSIRPQWSVIDAGYQGEIIWRYNYYLCFCTDNFKIGHVNPDQISVVPRGGGGGAKLFKAEAGDNLILKGHRG